MNPPPLPQEVPPQKTFAHYAAIASIVIPLVAVAANLTWRAAHSSESFSSGSSLIVSLLAIMLIIAGFVLAVVALFSIPRLGKSGLLAPGITGAVINSLLIAVMVGTVVVTVARRAAANRQALYELKSANEDFRRDMSDNYDPNAGITNSGLKRLGDLQSKMDSAASKASGQDALILQAGSAYTARMQAEVEKYQSAVQALAKAAPANIATLTTKSDIGERRTVVSNFLAANKVFKLFLLKQEQVMLTELETRNVSRLNIGNYMVGFRRTQEGVMPKVMAVRECDDKVGKAALKMLDIAEAQWGKFQVSKSTSQVVFENDLAADDFNEQVVALQKAARDQARIQGEIVKIQRGQPPTQE